MAVFFNGRLWKSPAVMSVVNDSAMNNKNLSVGNVVALIGQSVGGKPNTALRFGSPSEAIAVLRDGELLTAVLKSFDPSSQVAGPALVVAVRVNAALQSSLVLKDASAANVINLVSTDYGQYTNQIKAKIEAGSVSGRKLTTQFGSAYFSRDNVARQAFSLQYSGALATSTMSISNTTLTLSAPTGTPVATIDLASFPTVQALVDRINSTPGFIGTVLDGNGNTKTLSGLDTVTVQDVKTALYTVRADLQAAVDWFNAAGEGYVDATRATGAGTLPVALPFTYLSGGTDGVTTNTEWSNAYTAMQTIDVQWVVPISSTPSIHAMNDSHCSFMSNVARKERRGIVGAPTGTSDAAAIDLAKALNSDRTSLVHLGIYDYDVNGVYALQQPYILAALIAGAFSGVNPGTPLTNKSIKIRGIERNLRNPTDTDVLIDGGVLAIENTETGYRVVKSVTTWLNNTNYNRVEVSVGVALDFVARNVRQAVQALLGEKGTPITVARVVSRVDSTLRLLAVQEPQGPGVITGDAANPAYLGIRATLSGDVCSVEFQCSPVIPMNYIPVSIFAVPYSGSATA